MNINFSIHDLLRVAKRENNPKRSYLYINPIQGKHLPVSPTLSLALFSALAKRAQERFAGERLLVVGFAETATAIGAAIAYGAENADFFLTTTREAVPGAAYLFFTESHSHATQQRLAADGLAECLSRVDRVVFAEDEVTTGHTIETAIQAIRQAFPGLEPRFGILSILNSMSEERLQAMEAQGVAVDFLHRIPAQYLAEEIHRYQYEPLGTAAADRCTLSVPLWEEGDYWNARVVTEQAVLRERCRGFVSRLQARLAPLLGEASRILILGTEEFMFPGLLLGEALEKQYPEKSVRFHATTRSPIEVSRDEGYPLRQRFPLESVYEAGRRTFVYNLTQYDLVLILTDAAKPQPQGLTSLLGALERCGNRQIVVVKWGEA